MKTSKLKPFPPPTYALNLKPEILHHIESFLQLPCDRKPARRVHVPKTYPLALKYIYIHIDR